MRIANITSFKRLVSIVFLFLLVKSPSDTYLYLSITIGSNIFNVLAVLGITSMVKPIAVLDESLVTNDIWWMLGISVLLYPLMFLFKKDHFGRVEGLVLLMVYTIYILFLF